MVKTPLTDKCLLMFLSFHESTRFNVSDAVCKRTDIFELLCEINVLSVKYGVKNNVSSSSEQSQHSPVPRRRRIHTYTDTHYSSIYFTNENTLSSTST